MVHGGRRVISRSRRLVREVIPAGLDERTVVGRSSSALYSRSAVRTVRYLPNRTRLGSDPRDARGPSAEACRTGRSGAPRPCRRPWPRRIHMPNCACCPQPYLCTGWIYSLVVRLADRRFAGLPRGFCHSSRARPIIPGARPTADWTRLKIAPAVRMLYTDRLLRAGRRYVITYCNHLIL